MGKKEKLISKLKSIPNDMIYSDFKTVLESLGYIENNKGATSGSRVMFYRASDGAKIGGDRPHGNGPVAPGFIKRAVKYLQDKGDI